MKRGSMSFQRRMPFVIRTDADLEMLKRITGMDLKPVDFSTPIHIENVTVEPMEPVPLKLLFSRMPYAESLKERDKKED